MDKDELQVFLGIIIWMGLVKMPSISHYWKSSILYTSTVLMYMSKNRFTMKSKFSNCVVMIFIHNSIKYM